MSGIERVPGCLFALMARRSHLGTGSGRRPCTRPRAERLIGKPRHRLRLAKASLLATAVFLAACRPVAARAGGATSQSQLEQGGSATATLRGTILDAMTHQPVARALVSLDQYSQGTFSDNEGRFAFSGVPAGQTMLSARRPGYAGDGPGFANDGSASPSRQSVTITAPGSVDVTLSLMPLASITGELVLAGDDLPDGLQVQLLHQEIQNGHAHWSIYHSAEATSEGRFRFGNLPQGAYLVHVGASLDPAPAESVKIRMGYVPTFYPAAREVAGAGVLTLAPGQQSDIRMVLVREPYYPVTVPVNGDPSRGIGFEVSSDSFLGLSARYSPQDGAVHMELPSGHFRLEGSSFGPTRLSGQREFDVSGAPLRAGAITLLPSNRIPVSVHAEFSHIVQAAPASGAVLTAANQISLELQRDGSGNTRGGRAGLQDESSSSQSGYSYLGNIAPGRYWVNARPYFGYIASLSSGGVDLLEQPLVVGVDGSASPIEVTLRDDTATLSATLSGALGAGLSSSTSGIHSTIYLHLVPRSGPAVERTEAFAADGTMQLTNVAPGSYLAFATTVRRELAYRDSKVLASLESTAQPVTVEAGGAARISLETLLDAAGGEGPR